MDATTLLAAGMAFVAVAGAGLALTAPQGGQAAKRAKSLAAGAPGGRRTTRDSVADATLQKRRQANIDALKELSEREKQSRKVRLSIQGRLKQAALPISETTFWIISLSLGALIGLAAFLFGAPPAVAGALVVTSTLGAPRWGLSFLIKKRQKIFLEQFADGIDVIVRGVKSGLPLNQCMQIVANESAEPLKSEFQSLVDGQSMGVPLAQNMQRLYDRMPLPEINFFGIVLIIQQKTGGNLAEALGNLSGVLRSRKLLKEKIKALSAEARASAMIIGALPFIVMGLVHMSRPDYLVVLFTTNIGLLILIGCALMMGFGIFVMVRMVNFKY